MSVLAPREWLERQGLTQHRLAAILKRSPLTVWRWLNGERPWPHLEVVAVKRIARGQLTDESFLSPRQRQRVERIAKRV